MAEVGTALVSIALVLVAVFLPTAFLGGMTLTVLGIIGEYLARMHFRIMSKPTYVVSEEIAGE